MLLQSVLLVVASLNCVAGVFVDEAYQVDFHSALLGFPQADNTIFHQPYPNSKASLLYTLSEKSVLGAINPKDGQIVWRQALASQSPNGNILRTAEDLDVLVAASGSQLSAWSAVDGKLAWEKQYISDTAGSIVDIQVQPKDKRAIVALRLKNTLLKSLDAQTGEELWSYEDLSGDEVLRVSHDGGKIYLVSLHKVLLKGYKIKVTTIDSVTGSKITDYSLSSDGDVSSAEDVIAVTVNQAASLVAWTDAKRNSVKVNILGLKDVHTLDTTAGGKNVERIDMYHSTGGTHFLINFQTAGNHWAETFDVQVSKSSVKKEHVFPSIDGSGAWSAHLSGGEEYFVRVTETEIILDSPYDRITAYPTGGFKVAGLIDKVSPLQVTSEVVVKSHSNYAIRSAVLLTSGDWVMIRDGEMIWARPEALSDIIDVTWADVSDSREDIVFEASADPASAFVHRLRRHLKDIQMLPSLLGNLPEVAQGAINFFFSKAEHPSRSFGFDKLIIAVTGNGRYIALDVGRRGKVVWNAGIPSGGLPLKEAFQQIHTSYLQSQSLPASKLVIKDRSSGVEDAFGTTFKQEGGLLHGSRKGTQDPSWLFSPYPGFRILSITTPFLADEPIASIGKVLGDRRVLYKYLNPNAISVIAVNDEKRTISVNLIDAVTGNVLYTAFYGGVDLTRPIAAALADNWLAFSYTSDTTDDSVSKGFQLGMIEFYESDVPNDRGPAHVSKNRSTALSDASALRPFAYSQVFHIPEEISNMAVTQTAQGITTKQLLATIPRTNSIVGIPSIALDPRRIVGKDPTSEQMMEGLTKYTPMIDFDPKWYLNHREEILGVKKVMTTPAALESTSLVFAYGLDLFGTRVAPSFAFDILGNGFNKIQLSLTVVALFFGVFFVAPIIQRKQTNLLFKQ